VVDPSEYPATTMAAYAVIARIDRVDPHLAGRSPGSTADWTVVEALDSAQAVDLVGQPLETIVAERWAHLREIWAQTTFYLFDAESWR
jgi:hypothetical protein